MSFSPIMTETSNIALTIKEFAHANKLEKEAIDFEILSAAVVAFSQETGVTITYSSLTGNKIPDETLSNPDIDLIQKFRIRIKPFVPKPPIIQTSVILDADYVNATIVLKKNSVLSPLDGLKAKLYTEFNKKLALKNVLIFHLEGQLKQQIDMFVKSLEAGEQLTEDRYFIAASAHKYKPTIDDEITFKYLEKEHDDTQEKDMYSRDFITEAYEGEILVEYKKPHKGISGRNCLGRYVYAAEPLAKNAPTFLYDESVTTSEDDDYIYFSAAKTGCIEYEHNILKVNDTLKLQSVNARDTGSIKISDKSDVRLNVLEENPVYDAVGSGMTVKAMQVSIRGSMGEHSSIVAESAEVSGMTHATSRIRASKFAFIKNHKGYVQAKEVNIQNIEGGEVRCEIAKIQNAMSGRIYARKAYIDNLGSNCKIFASELIEITKISGVDNELVIEAAATTEDEFAIKELNDKIKDIKATAKSDLEHFNKLVKTINANKVAVEQIKAKIHEGGSQINPVLVDKYYEHQRMIKHVKTLQVKLDEVKEQINYYTHELNVIKNKVLDAKIKCSSPWREYQSIRFRAPDGNFYYFTPTPHLIIPSIGLSVNSSGEYTVRADV